MAKSKTDPRTPDSYPLSEPQDYCVFQLVLLFCTCIYSLPSPGSLKRALDTIRKYQLLSLITPMFSLISPNAPSNLDGGPGAPSTTVPRHTALTAHLLPVLQTQPHRAPASSQPLEHNLSHNSFAKPANLAA